MMMMMMMMMMMLQLQVGKEIDCHHHVSMLWLHGFTNYLHLTLNQKPSHGSWTGITLGSLLDIPESIGVELRGLDL